MSGGPEPSGGQLPAGKHFFLLRMRVCRRVGREMRAKSPACGRCQASSAHSAVIKEEILVITWFSGGKPSSLGEKRACGEPVLSAEASDLGKLIREALKSCAGTGSCFK